jgi:quinol monooxygenase YgiN
MIAIKAIARVTAGDMEPVVAAVREVKTASLSLPGALAYDFFQQDEGHLVTLEAYDSSEAVIAHVDGIDFTDLFAVVEMTDVEVFGNPSPELRARFDALDKVSIYPSVTADPGP